MVDKPRSLMCWNPNCDDPEDVEIDPLFLGIVLRLPKMGSKWSREQRDRWEAMFMAIADGLHPESMPPEDETEEEEESIRVNPDASIDVSSPERALELRDAMVAKERKFLQQTPYAGSKEASATVIEMIKQVGTTGHVWYNKTDGRIRVCAEDYKGSDEEVFVGAYDVKVKPSRIIADLKEVRADIDATENES